MIDSARLGEVQKGRTTASDVIRQFGTPSVYSKNLDGTQFAIYVHAEPNADRTALVPLLSGASRDSVTFYFDTRGVLTDVKTTQRNADNTDQPKAREQSPASSASPAKAESERPASAGGNPQPGNRPWSSPVWVPPSSTQNR